VAVARKGEGRVMLFTSTVDRDWGDFAIRTSFLPLMQRFCAYLTGSLDEREELRARVGETLVLRPEPQGRPAVVRAPSGGELPLKAQPDGTFVAGPVAEPGTHAVVDGAGKPLAALGFAATLDPSESDLARLRPEELAAYFGEESVKSAGAGDAARRVPFWTWLIVAAVAAFFFEGVLLRK
ncbi:MAG: BatA domain-containing protein, partial [Myxococcaceae bacterium]